MGRIVTQKLAVPQWTQYKLFTTPGTYTTEVVPADVYQMMLLVIGAGGSGGSHNASSPQATGGGGGGFACGIWDCVPGQAIATITVGAGGVGVIATNGNAGGTSSIGALLSATGGGAGLRQAGSSSALAGGAGGAGSTTGLRQAVTKSGGRGGNKGATYTGSTNYTGGGACGTILGDGGRGGDISATANTLGTGGGGINGGNGGDITGNASNSWTGGGGCGFRGGNVTGTSTGVKATGGGGSAGNGTDSAVTGTTTEATAGGVGLVWRCPPASAGNPIATELNIDWLRLLLFPQEIMTGNGTDANATYSYPSFPGAGTGGTNGAGSFQHRAGYGGGSGAINRGVNDAQNHTQAFGGTGANTAAGNTGTPGAGGGSGATALITTRGGNGLVLLAWCPGY